MKRLDFIYHPITPNATLMGTFVDSSFTGKERDEETGYSYFGARYYDADLLNGWVCVDPMADKYPSLSPYNYCVWNPVKLVDSDGKEIWIKGLDGNEYQYKGGKLYNKDDSEYIGNDDFATKVLRDLNTLNAKGMRVQVTSLVESNNKHIINLTEYENKIDPGKENEENISNGIGSGTTILYNPNRTEIEGWERPAVVGLAHEIQHAYEMDKGKYDKRVVRCQLIDIFCNMLDPYVQKRTIDLLFGGRFDFYYKVIKEDFIERGEFSAIQVANTVYSSLGGTNPRKKINGFSIEQLSR